VSICNHIIILMIFILFIFNTLRLSYPFYFPKPKLNILRTRGQIRCLESAAITTRVPPCKPGTPKHAGLGRGYIDRQTTSNSRIDARSSVNEGGTSPLGIQTSLPSLPGRLGQPTGINSSSTLVPFNQLYDSGKI